MNKAIKAILALSVVVLAIYPGYVFYFGSTANVQNVNAPKSVPAADVSPQQADKALSGNGAASVVPENETASMLTVPLSLALERVTKKPFGIKVSPENSPVSPEKFSGYHTGVDFETFPQEADVDVPVSAVCSGILVEKRTVSGYGGVAIQKCSIDNSEAMVLYGHLKLSSIEKPAGGEMSAGEKIGMLGKGYSAETGGERKHLHLGIHKGSKINYLGYVQNENELADWIDAMEYLK
ncbi:MAG: M23 family metallopeptidase [Candidatus Paceibacterota bacterium]|jgi:hypothetical protein